MHISEKSKEAFVVNDSLNPLLWDGNELRPSVRHKLLLIANHFIDTLTYKTVNLSDITISGSNASFNYSDSSDIDLHLLIDIPPDMNDYYTTKKNYYNLKYDLLIKNIPVEVYVQDNKQKHYSAGIFSILYNKWLVEPSKLTPSVSEHDVKSKARNYSSKINIALKSDNIEYVSDIFNDIRRLRQAGLEKGGELSIENLAYKLLRSRGILNKLVKHIDKLQSADLSLGEEMKIKDIMEAYSVTKNDPTSGLELTAQDGTKLILPPEKIAAIQADPTDTNINNPKNFIMPTNAVNPNSNDKISSTPNVGDTVDIPSNSITSETQEEEEKSDLIKSGLNRPIGGDGTDELLTSKKNHGIIDGDFEYYARYAMDNNKGRSSAKLKESDLLYKMLTIAGLR